MVLFKNDIAVSTAAKTNAGQKRKSSPTRSPPTQSDKVQRITGKMSDEDKSDEAPAYFKKFLNVFHEVKDEVSGIKTSVEEARAEARADAQRNREDNAKNSTEINLLKQHARLKDKCEILIIGIPIHVSLTDEVVLNKLAETLKISSFSVNGVDFRPWSNKPTAQTAYTRSLVAELGSPNVRDKFVIASALLKNLKASDVFGVGGNNSI